MADIRKISVTEGLRELKLYDAKINKAINSVQFVGATKKSLDTVGDIKRDVFCSNAKAGYQSVKDLIANRTVTIPVALAKDLYNALKERLQEG